MATPHDPYAPWREPPFRRYMVGNTAANLGQTMLATAIGWDLYERTGSALALGWAGLVLFLPVALLTLPAGQTADRHDRRLVLLAALGLLLLCSLGLAAASATRAPLWLSYGLLFFCGVAQAYYGPAKQALLPSLVSDANLAQAVGWSSGASQLAFLLGPALAGALIGAFHAAWPVYLADGVAAGLFLLALAGLRLTPAPREAPAPGWDELLAGLRFVGRTDLLLAAVTLDMVAVLLGGAVALLPIFAKDILHVGPEGLGALMMAPALGAFLMGVVLAHRPPLKRAGPALLFAVAGFGLATIGFGLARSFPLAWAMLFLTGVCDMVSVIVRQNLVQHLTPDAMRGRVMAVHGLFVGTSNELGAFESGLTASWWGPVRAVVVGGCGTLAVVAFAAWKWPALRKLGRIEKPAS